MKYKFGDKVIVKSKSVGCPIEESAAVNNMKKFNQPYLYFIEKTSNGYGTLCFAAGFLCERGSGDYFMEEDIEPYEKITPDNFYENIIGMEDL